MLNKLNAILPTQKRGGEMQLWWLKCHLQFSLLLLAWCTNLKVNLLSIFEPYCAIQNLWKKTSSPLGMSDSIRPTNHPNFISFSNFSLVSSVWLVWLKNQLFLRPSWRSPTFDKANLLSRQPLPPLWPSNWNHFMRAEEKKVMFLFYYMFTYAYSSNSIQKRRLGFPLVGLPFYSSPIILRGPCQWGKNQNVASSSSKMPFLSEGNWKWICEGGLANFWPDNSRRKSFIVLLCPYLYCCEFQWVSLIMWQLLWNGRVRGTLAYIELAEPVGSGIRGQTKLRPFYFGR